jgi:type I site-specific restriction-modification system R (restriction) subunit
MNKNEAFSRVLFLVDRIPLAKQTEDAFAGGAAVTANTAKFR